MSSLVEAAVTTYIGLVSERDPAVRAAMIEACWAVDGRLVSASGGISGRAALAEAVTRFIANPEWLRVRVVALDVQGHLFRFRHFTDRRDGTSQEAFDAGEVDASGRISLLLAFPSPLVECRELTLTRG
jgi:hypothetical protein